MISVGRFGGNKALLYLVEWLVVLRIYVALAVFQPYRDLETGDNQSLKFKWRGRESNPGHLALQAKSLITRPPPLPIFNIVPSKLKKVPRSIQGEKSSRDTAS